MNNHRMPSFLKEILRNAIGFAVSTTLIPHKGVFKYVGGAARRAIRFDIWANPDSLFQMRKVRQQVAAARARRFLKQDVRTAATGAQVARGTIDHNVEGAQESADLDRPIVLVQVATAIEKVRKNIENLDVLSVGPRSEIELFSIRAAGFRWDRIKAIDLFAYSPLVQVGDVHAIPFPDSSFDVVFLGWVLAYSKDQQGAIREVVRVLRPGGIAVVASDYSSEETHTRARVDSTHMQTTDQMLALFGEHAGYVYFRHDPRMPDIHMIMVAVEITKP